MQQRPDFEYIRKKVSIVAVAVELGLSVSGYHARCWRPEKHRNGDANPSVAFKRDKNVGRCFVCDAHPWSTIDLVMLVRGCDLAQAVSWITDRFPVPHLPKGTHVKKREAWSPRFRAGDTDDVIELLVRSGLWAALSGAERSLLPVLATFVDRETGLAKISYRGLMRYSGVGSQATISLALRHFEQMGFLRVGRSKVGAPLRGVNQYYFDFDDPKFQAMVSKVYQLQRAEIDLERKLMDEARKARQGQAVLI
jgi:hypothetical protein